MESAVNWIRNWPASAAAHGRRRRKTLPVESKVLVTVKVLLTTTGEAVIAAQLFDCARFVVVCRV